MKRILCIDDNIADYSILVARLRDYGVDVFWASSIHQAKIYLKSIQKFDFIICDMMGVGYSEEDDISFLDKRITLIVSGSVEPMFNVSFEFSTKDRIVPVLIKKLGLVKNG